jgi:hypothetical protein
VVDFLRDESDGAMGFARKQLTTGTHGCLDALKSVGVENEGTDYSPSSRTANFARLFTTSPGSPLIEQGDERVTRATLVM